MKNFLRSFTFAAATLSLVAAPMAQAERWGTNPPPAAASASSAFIVAYTVAVVLGV
ncbi:hypothetical protein [Granulicella sibirica]|uniref:Uncharacterized protein n=1 Tax=Granulicella sibirica TaxID=2479048 RepID=A0A4Q0T3E5_9BACT|nr:hypothetical protein [Granulicella sibirica]RXH57432.1 hypothetical protein GRAN_0742 [Granulicella sibirica]